MYILFYEGYIQIRLTLRDFYGHGIEHLKWWNLLCFEVRSEVEVEVLW